MTPRPLLALTVLIALCACAPVGSREGRQTEDVSAATEMSSMLRCLKRSGWDAEIEKETGALVFRGKPAEADRYEVDLADCSEQKANDTLSDADLSRLYSLDRAAMTCIAENGFRTGPFPTFDEYVDGFRREQPWSPYADVDAGNKRRWRQLNEVCPQPVLDD